MTVSAGHGRKALVNRFGMAPALIHGSSRQNPTLAPASRCGVYPGSAAAGLAWAGDANSACTPPWTKAQEALALFGSGALRQIVHMGGFLIPVRYLPVSLARQAARFTNEGAA
jgi:hypothetical protein